MYRLLTILMVFALGVMLSCSDNEIKPQPTYIEVADENGVIKKMEVIDATTNPPPMSDCSSLSPPGYCCYMMTGRCFKI
jgi:hypothetical protein